MSEEKQEQYKIEVVPTSPEALRHMPDLPEELFMVVDTTGQKVPFNRYRTRQRAQERIDRLKKKL